MEDQQPLPNKFIAIAFASFLLSNAAYSQKKCPPGKTYIPDMSTSSLIIQQGCYPDSIAKRIWIDFHKCICGEGGYGHIGKFLLRTHQGVWVNDSVGCVSSDSYKKKISGKWVSITKKEYDSLNQSNYKDGTITLP